MFAYNRILTTKRSLHHLFLFGGCSAIFRFVCILTHSLDFSVYLSDQSDQSLDIDRYYRTLSRFYCNHFFPPFPCRSHDSSWSETDNRSLLFWTEWPFM